MPERQSSDSLRVRMGYAHGGWAAVGIADDDDAFPVAGFDLAPSVNRGGLSPSRKRVIGAPGLDHEAVREGLGAGARRIERRHLGPLGQLIANTPLELSERWDEEKPRAGHVRDPRPLSGAGRV